MVPAVPALLVLPAPRLLAVAVRSYCSVCPDVGVNVAVLCACSTTSTNHALLVSVVILAEIAVSDVGPGPKMVDSTASGPCCAASYIEVAPTTAPRPTLPENVVTNELVPVVGANRYHNATVPNCPPLPVIMDCALVNPTPLYVTFVTMALLTSTSSSAVTPTTKILFELLPTVTSYVNDENPPAAEALAIVTSWFIPHPTLTDGVRDGVMLGVLLGVILTDGVIEGVTEGDCPVVGLTLGVIDGVTDGVTLGVGDGGVSKQNCCVAVLLLVVMVALATVANNVQSILLLDPSKVHETGSLAVVSCAVYQS